MFFYTLFAAALLWRGTGARVAFITASMVGLMALKPVIGHWGAAVHQFTSGLILEFLMGVWVGVLHARGWIRWPRIWLALGVGLALLFMHYSGLGTPRMAHAGLSAALVLAGMLGLGESGTRPGLLSWIGDASCSIYLSHTFVIDAVELLVPLNTAPASAVINTAVLCLGAGLFIYRWVELPLLRALRSPGQGRLAPHLGLKPPATPPGPRAP